MKTSLIKNYKQPCLARRDLCLLAATDIMQVVILLKRFMDGTSEDEYSSELTLIKFLAIKNLFFTFRWTEIYFYVAGFRYYIAAHYIVFAYLWPNGL